MSRTLTDGIRQMAARPELRAARFVIPGAVAPWGSTWFLSGPTEWTLEMVGGRVGGSCQAPRSGRSRWWVGESAVPVRPHGVDARAGGWASRRFLSGLTEWTLELVGGRVGGSCQPDKTTAEPPARPCRAHIGCSPALTNPAS